MTSSSTTWQPACAGTGGTRPDGEPAAAELGPEAFRESYPDFAVLFAWNHAVEIMAQEDDFAAAGGRWIQYVPSVHTA